MEATLAALWLAILSSKINIALICIPVGLHEKKVCKVKLMTKKDCHGSKFQNKVLQ